PDRLEEVVAERTGRLLQVPEESRAAPREMLADAAWQLTFRRARRRGEERVVIGEIERNAPIARPARIDPAPEHLAGRAEQIEIGKSVGVDPRRQGLIFEDAGGERSALDLLDRAEERVDATARARDPLPVELQARERRLFHRLHLLAKLRQRPPAQTAQDLG